MKKNIVFAFSLFFCGCGTLEIPKDGPRISVDYSRPMSAWVESGRYQRYGADVHKDDSLELFRSAKTGVEELRIEIFCYRGVTYPSGILSRLEKAKLRPANLQELFAYLEKYPETTDGRIVSALGSMWVDGWGTRHSPSIWGRDRIISFGRLGTGELYGDRIDESFYDEGSCFAAVPK